MKESKSTSQVKNYSPNSDAPANENASFSVASRKFLKKCADFAVNVLYPEKIKCIFCDTDILDFDERPYCDACAEKQPFNNGRRCAICDSPIESEAVICDFCQKNPRSFKKAFCPLVYEGEVASKILAFKNENQRHLATGFAILVAQRLRAEGVKIDVITYVPMTKEREKWRTFNQSKLLAEKLGELLCVPVRELLIKTHDIPEQKALTYKQRQENAKNVYALSATHPKKSDKVLIVDDVITTCATIDACAKLLKSKTASVYVCAIAKQYIRPETLGITTRTKAKKFSFEE